MTDPVSHTIGGTALAVPIATATASIFGIETAAIGWAFIGGVLSLIWMPKFNYWLNALISIASSTVVCACIWQWSTEPVLLTVQHFAVWLEPWAQTAQPTAMCAIAMFSGLFTQKAMPGLLTRVGFLSKGKQE